MLFLVELDHVRTGPPPTPESGRTFIQEVILPTLARVEQLSAEKTIVAGGPVAGRIALRLMVEAESALAAERVAMSLPVWAQADTRITPLIRSSERRESVEALLKRLG